MKSLTRKTSLTVFLQIHFIAANCSYEADAVIPNPRGGASLRIPFAVDVHNYRFEAQFEAPIASPEPYINWVKNDDYKLGHITLFEPEMREMPLVKFGSFHPVARSAAEKTFQETGRLFDALNLCIKKGGELR